jgi:hypothetical protein
MAEQLSVRPKPGIAFPRAAPLAGFVGYETATSDPEDEEDDDHVMAGGPRYRVKGAPELVPNTVYYRRALARGDIRTAGSDPESTPFESAG